MASPSPYDDPPLPAGVFLGIALVMALLGGGLVIEFLVRYEGTALGFALVCLGAAGFAAWTFPSIRRSRRHGRNRYPIPGSLRK